MILADTSVWIDHFRKRSPRLCLLLEEGRVLTHSFVIGELACGMLADRKAVLDLLAELPSVPVATDSEVIELIEQRGLAGWGIGFVDAHLLAAAMLGGVPLWTLDRRLAALASRLGVAFSSDA